MLMMMTAMSIIMMILMVMMMMAILVCRGEEKWIFPHQNEADYVINSAMEYELCVLKSRFLHICHAYIHSPKQ